MSRLVIWPYKMASKSARDLAEELDVLRVRSNGNYRPRPEDVILNWGNSRIANWHVPNLTILNHPHRIQNASNKALSFSLMRQEGVRVPDYTFGRAMALEWLTARNRVLSRSILTGHGGAGITVVNPGDELPEAPLYVKYVKKVKEYRVHVWDNAIISVSEKRRRNNPENFNRYIRNFNNGWVFCRISREDIDVGIETMCQQALNSLNLTFGAVDVIVGRDDNLPYVLEANTAPGIEGQTLEAYVDHISYWMEENNLRRG